MDTKDTEGADTAGSAAEEELSLGITFIDMGGPAKVPVTASAESSESSFGPAPVAVNKAVSQIGPQNPALWRGDIQDISLTPETYAGAGDLIQRRPDNLEDLYKAYRLSAVLGPIVAALTTNVYQAPHAFVPAEGLDPDDEEETKEVLRSYLAYEKSGGDLEADPEVSEEELQKEFRRFIARLRNETLFLKSWIKSCCLDMTFLQLRILTGQDLEIQGSAFWEVLRDVSSRPSRVAWCPAWSMHAQPQEPNLRLVEELQPSTPVHWSVGQQLRRFRSYVQVDSASTVVAHFKEYGDSRTMSRKTGRYYATPEDMAKNQPTEKDAQVATEILHFKLPSSSSWTYGKPEWTNAYPNVTGSRDLEEMNMKVITDQVIPQLMLLISGGRGVKKEDQLRISEQIEQNVRENKRGIYVVHALPSTAMTGKSTDVTMHLERLKSEQHQDALGLGYLKHSREMTRGTVRLPKVAIGDEEGINRSTAGMLLRLAENQVYEPRREIFDDTLNSTLIRDLGIQCARYRTQSRVPKDPAEITEMLTKLMSVGVLAQEDGRQIAESVFDRQFKKAKGIWSKISPRILTALLQTKNTALAAVLLMEGGNVEEKLRQALLSVPVSDAASEAEASGGADVGAGGRMNEDGLTSGNVDDSGEPGLSGMDE